MIALDAGEAADFLASAFGAEADSADEAVLATEGPAPEQDQASSTHKGKDDES